MAEALEKFSDLADFRISPSLGFLLENPCKKLPNYFEPWERIAENMMELIEKDEVRSAIDELPILDHTRLEGNGISEEEGYKNLRLAHLQLTTLMSGYVWSRGDLHVPRRLPKQIAVPLWNVCERLGGMKPGMCYSAVVLANCEKIDSNKPARVLTPHDNLRLISFKMIPDFGNNWFFLIAAQIELDFAPAIPHLIRGIRASLPYPLGKENRSILIDALRQVTKTINKMELTLEKMPAYLKPDVFFNVFRPYVAGFTSGRYKEWGGIIFDGVSPLPQPLVGGSAAESPTLQCIDAFLGVRHDSLGSFLSNMREYMLLEHRRFIEFIEETSKVRERVGENLDDKALGNAYEQCLQAVVDFRNAHIRIVTRFVMNPRVRAQRSRESSPDTATKKQEGKTPKSYESLDNVGTGGTEIFIFLKAVRDNVRATSFQKKLES